MAHTTPYTKLQHIIHDTRRLILTYVKVYVWPWTQDVHGLMLQNIKKNPAKINQITPNSQSQVHNYFVEMRIEKHSIVPLSKGYLPIDKKLSWNVVHLRPN